MAVALTPVQAEFGSDRGGASLPYTLTMIGFGIGGIVMGRLADRFGVAVPVVIGAFGLGAGFIAAGLSQSLLQFALAQGVLIGMLGCSTTFAPLVADTSLWFNKRRGIAVAICASGNYLPARSGRRSCSTCSTPSAGAQTYIGVGVFCAATLLALSFFMRKRPPVLDSPSQASIALKEAKSLGLSSANSDGPAVRGGNRLLRGDVDAAGPHRRLLRRAGLRRGARRGDALADARLRHRQPARLGLDLATTSAACAR